MAITYKKSGVDIAAGDALVEYIQKKAPAVGGFAGLFPLELGGKQYNIVGCTDGVGTKLKLAFLTGRHSTVGIDLVAMNVNDLITCGAKPLFFLDYYATSRLDPKTSRAVIDGILEGCRQGEMALLGGETAEMPGFYGKGEYDLAGFAVGIVESGRVIDGSRIMPGDALIGLPSTGFHSNGYSLIRGVYRDAELKKRAARLLAPTKIYVKDIAALRGAAIAAGADILGMAHITGGGIVENVPRFLPGNCAAVIDAASWKRPKIMRDIAKGGDIPAGDMWRTFNMGIGMVIALRPQAVEAALKTLPEAVVLGRVERGENKVILQNAERL
ncbi:MAG: phosphoribosylformylglycinamidine cyclo-ligase [Elusimicrobiales bacterium]